MLEKDLLLLVLCSDVRVEFCVVDIVDESCCVVKIHTRDRGTEWKSGGMIPFWR